MPRPVEPNKINVVNNDGVYVATTPTNYGFRGEGPRPEVAIHELLAEVGLVGFSDRKEDYDVEIIE